MLCRFLCVLSSLVVLASATVTPVRADYPERIVRAIVPFATGGTTDLVARLISPHLSKELGQSVVVENRVGAAAAIGMDAVAKALPDGYTILYNASAATQLPALARNLRFDPLSDLLPVATISEQPWAIVVNSHLPVKDLLDFVKFVQKNPGKLNASSGGTGTRLALELFKIKTNTDVEIINYNGGGPSAIAVVTGEGQFAIFDVLTFLPYLAAGKVKLLAIAGSKRLPSFPDIPTTKEAGLPAYTASSTTAIYVPGKTPAAVVHKLNATVNKIIAMPEVRDQIQKLGGYPLASSVDESTQWYRRDIQTWKDIVVRAKIPLAD